MSFEDAALAEFAKEAASRGGDTLQERAKRVLARLFDKQQLLVLDPYRFKCLLCPRRSGKSIAILGYLFFTALMFPRVECVYVATTRDQAKRVLWDEALQWNHDLELGGLLNIQELTIRFPNGSKVSFGGAETEADTERYRGRKYKLFVIDEAASFKKSTLDGLIAKVVIPALKDLRGTLLLAGTPGHILDGSFYQVTGPPAFEIIEGKCRSRPFAERDDPKWADVSWSWSFHRWLVSENAAMPHLWAEALADKDRLGWTDENPIWIREGLGRWAADDTNLVYRLNPEKNFWEPGKKTPKNPFGLPEGHDWRYVMGIDFGTKDPFALEVVAYADTHPHLFQCFEHYERGLHIPGWAAAIRKVTELVDIEAMVGDFSGTYGDVLQAQLAEEYGFVIEKAEKKDKRDHIELLNSDFIDGRAFVLADSKFAEQALFLSWDDTGLKEKSGMRNDCTDAMVYTWRLVQHHFHQPAPDPGPDKGSSDWHRAKEQAAIEALIVKEQKRQHPELFDDWTSGDDFWS